MLPGTHIWSRREAPETSRRISPIWRFGRFVPVSRARRKFPEARVACGYELPGPRAGYRAVLYISGISSTWSRESLAKARHSTRSSHRSHVP